MQVVSSSLLALATLLDVFVSLNFERSGFEDVVREPKHAAKARITAISYAEKLFANHQCFLGFLKSNSSAVRSATYVALRSFIKNVPHVFTEKNMRTLSVAILGSFQEKDPSCHPSMWDAVLLFCKTFPSCWTSLNLQDGVLKQLWHFLSNGCFGSQQASYPALLVLVGFVPSELVGEQFLLDLLQKLWEGRSHSVLSGNDRHAFFAAFNECFLWAFQNASR